VTTDASIVVAIEDEIHHFKYSSDQWKITPTNSKGDLRATSAALAALRTLSDMPEINQLAKMIRLTSDLAKLTLESIESKFVIEARDLVSRDATGFSATMDTCASLRKNESFVAKVLEEVPGANAQMVLQEIWQVRRFKRYNSPSLH
jgi:hypothetical protein